MKKLLTPFAVFLSLFFSDLEAFPQNSNKEETKTYTDYREIDNFKDFSKVTDTSFTIEGIDPTHRVTELQKDDRTVILFSKISLDATRQEHYSLLDTLEIATLREPFYVSIGYCYHDDLKEQQVIALVERTTERTVGNIIKVWKADTDTQEIQEIEKPQDLECLNEFFQ